MSGMAILTPGLTAGFLELPRDLDTAKVFQKSPIITDFGEVSKSVKYAGKFQHIGQDHIHMSGFESPLNLDTDVLYPLVEWRVDTLFLGAFGDEEVDTFGADYDRQLAVGVEELGSFDVKLSIDFEQGPF